MTAAARAQGALVRLLSGKRAPCAQDAYIARCVAYRRACEAIEAAAPKAYMVPHLIDLAERERMRRDQQRRAARARRRTPVLLPNLAPRQPDDLPF